MSDTIAVTGVVATPPNPISTGDGLKITSFRLASTQRRFDRGRDRWVDGETNWYTVTTFRQLAINVGNSVVKGDKVVVTGRLRVREWESGEKKGINVDIEADSVGHDLAWGTTSFTRVSHAPVAVEPPASEADEFAPAGAGDGGFLEGDSAMREAVDGAHADDDDAVRPAFGEPAATAPF
jgi:single-strand DNA-binding protein